MTEFFFNDVLPFLYEILYRSLKERKDDYKEQVSILSTWINITTQNNKKVFIDKNS
jgi:hypothetical protein